MNGERRGEESIRHVIVRSSQVRADTKEGREARTRKRKDIPQFLTQERVHQLLECACYSREREEEVGGGERDTESSLSRDVNPPLSSRSVHVVHEERVRDRKGRGRWEERSDIGRGRRDIYPNCWKCSRFIFFISTIVKSNHELRKG